MHSNCISHSCWVPLNWIELGLKCPRWILFNNFASLKLRFACYSKGNERHQIGREEEKKHKLYYIKYPMHRIDLRAHNTCILLLSLSISSDFDFSRCETNDATIFHSKFGLSINIFRRIQQRFISTNNNCSFSERLHTAHMSKGTVLFFSLSIDLGYSIK